MISCSATAEEDAVDGSTIGGPVLRVLLRDNAQQRATFDIPLELEHTGGPIDDFWGHLVLSVSPTGVRSFLDGIEVEWWQYGWRARDRNTAENLAFPNPVQFQGSNRFSSFVMTAVTPQPYDGPALEWVGCYVDTRDRTFTEEEATFKDSNTPVKCAQHCASSGEQYTHFAVRWGQTCSCSSYAPDAPTSRGFVHVMAENQEECNLPCPGATHLACGGNWRNGVYRFTGSRDDIAALPESGECDWFGAMSNYAGPGLRYLGCHVDSSQHPLFTGAHFVGEPEPLLTCQDLGSNHACQGSESLIPAETVGRGGSLGCTNGLCAIEVEPMHVELCARKCGEQGFRFIALFASSSCYCSNDSPRQAGGTPAPEMRCNDECAGAHTQWCGDGGRSSHSSVYEITALASVPINQCAGFSPPSSVIFGHRSGSFGYSNGFSGSFAGTISGVELLSNSINEDEADCLFRYGEAAVAVCPAIEDTPQLHYFQSFLPTIATDGQLRKTLMGRPSNGQYGSWPGRGTGAALEQCVRACQDEQAIFAGLEGMFCSCGNEYSGAGRADDSECDINGDGLADCGRELQDITPDMLSGDVRLPPCVGRQTVYQIGTMIGTTLYATNDNVK